VTISISRYVDLTSGVPLPTREQIENFVDYVSHAHSWYKHLSLYPPGVPFHFFVDQYAGCDRNHGAGTITERTQTGFHYAQIPTNTYRSAFGHLAYEGRGNPVVVLVRNGRVVESRNRVVAELGEDVRTYGLPDEILQAGTTLVTGVIHALSAGIPFLWAARRPTQVEWPEESGGLNTLRKILGRCREIHTSGSPEDTVRGESHPKNYPSESHHVGLTDPVLYELLLPERRRQQRQMMRAIERVCELVERQRARST
jgi:hypothetical protein